MKIYTRTGDQGETSLFGGRRVRKNQLQIEAFGEVDELNSYIGLLRDFPVNAPHSDFLKEIQDRLFTIGATLAADPGKPGLKKPDLHEKDITLMENWIDEQSGHLEELQHFILPGGHQEVSFAHIARCVCRRTERKIIGASEVIDITPLIITYINRLSDVLFILARVMGTAHKAPEVKWIPRQ